MGSLTRLQVESGLGIANVGGPYHCTLGSVQLVSLTGCGQPCCPFWCKVTRSCSQVVSVCLSLFSWRAGRHIAVGREQVTTFVVLVPNTVFYPPTTLFFISFYIILCLALLASVIYFMLTLSVLFNNFGITQLVVYLSHYSVLILLTPVICYVAAFVLCPLDCISFMSR